MPKIIDGLKARILTSAGRLLLERGYRSFTIRAVARDCGVAVGTIYNYFPNKLLLVASVMAEDWQKTLLHIQADIALAPDPKAGLSAIQDGLQRFCGRFEPVWDQFSPGAGDAGAVRERRALLRDQIAQLVALMLKRFSRGGDPATIRLFAECVLACALQTDIPFSALIDACDRLFPIEAP